MLVLTRKKGERVMIGDDIVVTVIDVRGDGVRIGFDAPRGVSIQRAEVLAAVQAANTGAASSAAQSADLLVGLLSRARRASPGAGEPAVEADAATERPEASGAAGSGRRVGTVPPAAPGVPPKPAPPRPRD